MILAREFWLLPLDNLSQVDFWATVKLLIIIVVFSGSQQRPPNKYTEFKSKPYIQKT